MCSVHLSIRLSVDSGSAAAAFNYLHEMASIEYTIEFCRCRPHAAQKLDTTAVSAEMERFYRLIRLIDVCTLAKENVTQLIDSLFGLVAIASIVQH